MKHIVLLALIGGVMALCGCSSEKTPEPQQKIPAIKLSPAEKEKLLTFRKEILSVEGLADKAVKVAGDELKNVIKGGEVSTSLSSSINRAKSECLQAGESLVNKSVPETLPPELKRLLNDGKSGLIASYKAYVESYDAIRSFATDKNPMALLEYRKKSSQAQELFIEATDKIKNITMAAGVSQ